MRVLSMAASVGTSIWTARVMGPDKLGISTLAMAFATQAGLFVALNQDPSLVRRYAAVSASTESERSEFVSSLFYFRFLAWLFVALIGLVYGLMSGSMWPALGAVLCGAATANSPLWLMQAQERMVTQIRLTIFQQVLIALVVFVFLRKTSPAGFDLFLSGLVACAISFVNWRLALGKARLSLAWPTNFLNKSVQLIKGGRWLFFTGLAIYAYTKTEQILLGALANVADLGKYRTALQVSAAVTGITTLVPMVLYPKFIKWQKEGDLVLWKHQKRIGGLASLVCAFLLALAMPIITHFHPVVFGRAYETAAWPAVFLVASQFVIVLNSIFCWGLWAQSRDRDLFWLFLAVGIFSTGSNLWAIPQFGMLGAAVVNLLSESLVLVVSFWMCARSSKKYRNQVAAVSVV